MVGPMIQRAYNCMPLLFLYMSIYPRKPKALNYDSRNVKGGLCMTTDRFRLPGMHAEANEDSGISGSQTWCDYLDTASRSSSKGSTTDQVIASPTGERLGNRTVIA